MLENDTVMLYESLRKEAVKNVIKTGVEHLSFDLCEWRVEECPETRSKNIIITITINNQRKVMKVRFDQLEIHARDEPNKIKAGRIISERIRVEIANFVAGELGSFVCRGLHVTNI